MNDAPRRRRLVLALEAGANDPPGLLAAAVNVAMVLRADLDARLIEDENILRAAELPDTWLVPALGASTKMFDTATLRRAFRVRSADVRKQLAVHADARALRWTLKTESGSLADRLAEMVTGMDTVVVCHMRRRGRDAREALAQALRQISASVFLYNRHAQFGEKVIAMYTGEDSILATAQALASEVGLPFEVLLLAHDVESLKSRADAVEQWLSEHGQTTVPGGILMDGAGEWIDRLVKSSPATFVCVPDGSGITDASIGRLADAKSVMIVRV
tara:strand:- start:50955 stop:51776 length:822 start_codon:yes stop_codon:yes gene_type:complete